MCKAKYTLASFEHFFQSPKAHVVVSHRGHRHAEGQRGPLCQARMPQRDGRAAGEDDTWSARTAADGFCFEKAGRTVSGAIVQGEVVQWPASLKDLVRPRGKHSPHPILTGRPIQSGRGCFDDLRDHLLTRVSLRRCALTPDYAHVCVSHSDFGLEYFEICPSTAHGLRPYGLGLGGRARDEAQGLSSGRWSQPPQLHDQRQVGCSAVTK